MFGFPMMIAATDEISMAERFGRVCAAEGRRACVNWMFSPVCDIDMNFRNPITNVRTYGSDRERVRTGIVTMERLDEAVTRILALMAKVCFAPACAQTIEPGAWHRECAEKSVTLVKNLRAATLPMTPERYPRIRLITLGRDDIQGGSVREIARAWLTARGFEVACYDPLADELHGTARLSDRRMTLCLANYEQASNQTTVRAQWCKKHAPDGPRFLNEEPTVFVSLANPYRLQDVPRVKTYINAYTATRTVIEVVLEKLAAGGPFAGTSPVDAFCGLPDTRL